MNQYPIFLSIVFVVKNQENSLEKILSDSTELVKGIVSDWEIVVIDNASNDNSIPLLQSLTGRDGIPNIQVFSLTKEVDSDTASWVGVENSLGDFVAVLDPMIDDVHFLPKLLSEATCGVDVVFAKNKITTSQTLPYKIANVAFSKIYKKLTGIDMAQEAPKYRVLSKKVVNFILQHPHPSSAYRHLPITAGFKRKTLIYSFAPSNDDRKKLNDSIDRGINLLVSTTKAPIRLVTSISILAAGANLVYSVYILIMFMLKDDLVQGWASMSLQISGMFFLISIVLFVLGEYILHIASISSVIPQYHIAQEITSSRITREEKLNIEE